MIKKEQIEKLAYQDLSEEYFIVSISIKKGNVIEVIEQPHQLMLTILYQGQEAYIPLHEESLKGVDHAKKTVTVLLPDGLLDLYSSV